MRLSAEIGADASPVTGFGAAAILSPDGTRLAFVAAGPDQKRRIYVRSLDQLQATVLSGTENSRNHFFSPDGQWLGFFADGKLKKIPVQGGAAATLCDALDDRGGSWGEDGTIVFTPAFGAPLSKVSSAGGTPQLLTSLDMQAGELTHRWPQVLPGGKAVLFTSSTLTGFYEDADIVLYSMASGQRKTVQRGGFHARYLPTGHLVYMHEGTLFAVPFDLKRLEVTGQPAPILDGIVTNTATGGAQFSFSESGNLVYVAGGTVVQNISVYWMDRQGKFAPLRETLGAYISPALSPDGKRLALQVRDGKRMDIWVDEWERDTLTRLTFGGEFNSSPVWRPDGQRITYSSRETGGAWSLYWKRADGAGDALRLTESKNAKYPNSWRPDGKVLAFTQLNPDTSWDILALPIEGDEKSGWKPGEPKPFLNGPFNEYDPAFSPDGRWLAYSSNESGNPEVYVRPFPGPGVQVADFRWGRLIPQVVAQRARAFLSHHRQQDHDGCLHYYRRLFHVDKPQLWSPGQFTGRGPYSNFDVHPDGKRFVVLKDSAVLKDSVAGEAKAVNKVSFILNFFEELRRKVPPGKN